MRINRWVRGARVKDDNGFPGTLIATWDHKSLFVKVKYDHKKEWVYSIARFVKLDRKRKVKV